MDTLAVVCTYNEATNIKTVINNDKQPEHIKQL